MRLAKKIHLVGEVQTVDMQTGEVTETKQGAMMLLPAAPGTCEVCATKHESEMPHNQQSLFYQMAFHSEHKRWPTWADAMAHCTLEMQEQWRKHLRARGVSEKQLGIAQGQN